MLKTALVLSFIMVTGTAFASKSKSEEKEKIKETASVYCMAGYILALRDNNIPLTQDLSRQVEDLCIELVERTVEQ